MWAEVEWGGGRGEGRDGSGKMKLMTSDGMMLGEAVLRRVSCPGAASPPTPTPHLPILA